MDWVFFADNVYKTYNAILFAIFEGIYLDFSVSLRIVLNSLFHLFIVIYAFLAIKSGIISSIFSIARTIGLLLLTFNISFNYSTFKTWVFEFIIDFPTDVATYFTSSTISALIPGFKPPESYNTSQVFAQLTDILIRRAQSTNSGFANLPSFEGVYLYVMAIMVVILYFMFWIIQFSFLVQVSLYLIIGIPILMLASFRETQQIFFEWLRAVVTLMLYPILASILIFLLLNIMAPLLIDIKNIVNDAQVGLSAAGTLFTTLVFGIYSIKFIPSMAAVLTRGTMTTGNPLGFVKDAAFKTIGAAMGSANNIRQGIGSAAGKMSAYNASDPDRKDKGPSIVDSNKDNLIQNSNSQNLTVPFGSQNQNLPVAASGSNNYQSLHNASSGGISQSSGPSGPSAPSPGSSPNDISLKPESVINVPPTAQIGHSPSGSGHSEQSAPVLPAIEAGSEYSNSDITSVNSESSNAQSTDDSQSAISNEGDDQSQSVSSQNNSQASQSDASSQQISETRNSEGDSFSNSVSNQSHQKTANQQVSSKPAKQRGPVVQPVAPSRSEPVQQHHSTNHSNSPSSGQGGASIMPKHSPLPLDNPSSQPAPQKDYAPKIDVKD